MKEIVNLHVGQAGIQLGDACWQLFCLEHNILPDGSMPTISKNNAYRTFFSQSIQGKYIPRSIYVDLEPEIIDEVRSGMHRRLFNPSQLVSGKQNAANNYARGYQSFGKTINDCALNEIRKLVEKCDNFQGFVVYNSLGGGTGSGSTTLLLQNLSQAYQKKLKFGLNIFPSQKLSNSCTQPYNSILSIYEKLQHQDISIVLDNQAIYNICSRNLGIQSPNHKNLNRLIAQVVASHTSAMRFEGTINSTLSQIQANLVPYPRIHNILSSYAPFLNAQRAYHQRMCVGQISNQLFCPANQMAYCDPIHGKFMACTIIYKGDIVPKDISASIGTLKCRKTINFVDWSPTGFRCGIDYQESVVAPGSGLAKTMRSCSMLSNSSSIKEVFARLNHKFDLMYTKRAFVHWYITEGMEEQSFSLARQELAALQMDYEQIQKQDEEIINTP